MLILSERRIRKSKPILTQLLPCLLRQFILLYKHVRLEELAALNESSKLATHALLYAMYVAGVSVQCNW